LKRIREGEKDGGGGENKTGNFGGHLNTQKRRKRVIEEDWVKNNGNRDWGRETR